jgi:hypothetical protein
MQKLFFRLEIKTFQINKKRGFAGFFVGREISPLLWEFKVSEIINVAGVYS